MYLPIYLVYLFAYLCYQSFNVLAYLTYLFTYLVYLPTYLGYLPKYLNHQPTNLHTHLCTSPHDNLLDTWIFVFLTLMKFCWPKRNWGLTLWYNHQYLKSPNKLSRTLAQAKNGDKYFWNKSFMRPMRMLNMPSWGAQFFFFERRGRIFWFPNVFPSGSQSIPQVPKLFLKMFPIPTQFYPIWFGQRSTPMYI